MMILYFKNNLGGYFCNINSHFCTVAFLQCGFLHCGILHYCGFTAQCPHAALNRHIFSRKAPF